MERIRGSDIVMVESNIKDDEAYHIIIDCIKSYKHILKLGDIFKYINTCHLIQKVVECRICI